MSIGEYHSKKYSNDINEFAKDKEVHVLTNYPEHFKNCIVQNYDRTIFSYYQKLPFLLSLVLKIKNRVTYFDSDSIDLVKNKDFKFDNKSAYTYKIFYNTNYTNEELRTDTALSILCDIYEELGYEMCNYLHERVLSIPYSSKIKKVFDEIVKLQPIFEEKYPKGKEWNKHDFKNYSKNGCGYGEGGALSIVLKNNNIKVLQLIEKTLF